MRHSNNENVHIQAWQWGGSKAKSNRLSKSINCKNKPYYIGYNVNFWLTFGL